MPEAESTEPEVLLEESDTKGRFYVRSEQGPSAEMTFSKAGSSLMIIDHTEVPEVFSGKGIGVRLIQSGIEYARREGRKIVPLCPYAAHQFRKHAEWHDVLDK